LVQISITASESRSPGLALISNVNSSVKLPTVVPSRVIGRLMSTTSVLLGAVLTAATAGASLPSSAMVSIPGEAISPTWNKCADRLWVTATPGENGCPWVSFSMVTRYVLRPSSLASLVDPLLTKARAARRAIPVSNTYFFDKDSSFELKKELVNGRYSPPPFIWHQGK